MKTQVLIRPFSVEELYIHVACPAPYQYSNVPLWNDHEAAMHPLDEPDLSDGQACGKHNVLYDSSA